MSRPSSTCACFELKRGKKEPPTPSARTVIICCDLSPV